MRRTVLLMVSTALAGLLASGVALVGVEDPARAAFPGENGKIAFVSTRDGSHDIFVMDSSGADPINLTKTLSASQEGYPAWSPDGTKVAFNSSISSQPGIYVMNADGSNKRFLTSMGSQPAWSPDGTKIAFASAGRGDIFVMKADGSNPTNITNSANPVNEPAWSPDGTKITFTKYDECAINRIYVMNADGSNIDGLSEPCGRYKDGADLVPGRNQDSLL